MNPIISVDNSIFKNIVAGLEIFIFSLCLVKGCGGGFQAWSKEQGLGPCGEGLRGFKSHPPHHNAPTRILEVLLYLRSQGYSDSTLKAMVRKLRVLARKVDLQDPERVKRFIAEQPYSSGHKGNLVTAYGHYAEFHGIPFVKPFYERVDKIQRVPKTEDINKIIAECSPKYALCFSIIRDSGIRPIEASWLKVMDIDRENRLLYPRTAKHGSARILKLKPSTVAMLNIHISEKGLGEQDRLFPSLRGLRDNWMRVKKRVAEKLGEPHLKTIKLYDLRHHFATTTYQQTKDIVHVQRLLGHKNIQNTLRYIGILDLDKDEEYICKAAKTVEEATGLIEAGFQYVTEMDGLKLFRKRK